MVTAYDATFARILDDAGADVLLVGDSLGMVVQGNDSTLPVTMDQMVYHSRAVTRGAQRAHVVGDMPFISYQASVPEAVHNAGRLVAEGGVGSVKLEGGEEFADTVAAIVRAEHPGDGPPRAHPAVGAQDGRLRGAGPRRGAGAEDLPRRRGAASAPAATRWCSRACRWSWPGTSPSALQIPTIGIGAGVHCDGQVLVCYDLFGLNPDFKPKFVKRFADGYGTLRGAAETFFADVRSGAFPDLEHSFQSKTLRILPGGVSGPAPSNASQGEEKIGPVYGVPV